MLNRKDANIRTYPLALMHRVRGLAMWRNGDSEGARSALEAGIAAARKAGDLFELTIASLALAELDRRRGRDPEPDIVAEIESLMSRLKIKTVPAALIAPQPA
jgi:hypothetical protein